MMDFYDAARRIIEGVPLFSKITKAAGESAPADAVTADLGGMESSLQAGRVKRAVARVDGAESAEAKALHQHTQNAAPQTESTKENEHGT